MQNIILYNFNDTRFNFIENIYFHRTFLKCIVKGTMVAVLNTIILYYTAHL